MRPIIGGRTRKSRSLPSLDLEDVPNACEMGVIAPLRTAYMLFAKADLWTTMHQHCTARALHWCVHAVGFSSRKS
jgi:hypothetical protein